VVERERNSALRKLSFKHRSVGTLFDLERRFKVIDLASMSMVAKDWHEAVRTVGWKAALANSFQSLRSATVDPKVTASNALFELKVLQNMENQIVATNAKAFFKLTLADLSIIPTLKVQKNPYNPKHSLMRTFKTKDILQGAFLKHGGAAGLKKKIEKCQDISQKRAEYKAKRVLNASHVPSQSVRVHCDPRALQHIEWLEAEDWTEEDICMEECDWIGEESWFEEEDWNEEERWGEEDDWVESCWFEEDDWIEADDWTDEDTLNTEPWQEEDRQSLAELLFRSA
jgi:hypothetical protein